jgi:hypothetical protein
VPTKVARQSAAGIEMELWRIRGWGISRLKET